MRPCIVGVAGSLGKPSRTRVLVETAVERSAARYGLDGKVLDLLTFSPSLGSSARLADLDRSARDAVEEMLEADALVLASPVYKGSYSGLFKHLMDLLDPRSLVGKPVLLGAVGGGPRHALVIEHQLRPLLGFFEAQTLATGVYAADSDFEDGVLASPAALERLDRAIAQFAPFLDLDHAFGSSSRPVAGGARRTFAGVRGATVAAAPISQVSAGGRR